MIYTFSVRQDGMCSTSVNIEPMNLDDNNNNDDDDDDDDETTTTGILLWLHAIVQ